MSVFDDEINKIIETESETVINHFSQEINQLRSNRPTPALVENLLVEYYENKVPLKQVAAIGVVMPSTIIIEPWDKSVIPAIVQALSSSNLNLAPIVDSDKIRLTLPPLSEERRKQLIKLLSEYAENARVRMRQIRDKANKKSESLFKEKKISEDEKFKFKSEIQKLIDEFNETIKEMSQKKERELTS